MRLETVARFFFFSAMDIDMEGLMMIYFVFLFHFQLKMLCFGRCLLFAVSIFTVCCMGRHHPRCSSSWIIFPALIKRQSPPPTFHLKSSVIFESLFASLFSSIITVALSTLAAVSWSPLRPCYCSDRRWHPHWWSHRQRGGGARSGSPSSRRRT